MSRKHQPTTTTSTTTTSTTTTTTTEPPTTTVDPSTTLGPIDVPGTVWDPPPVDEGYCSDTAPVEGCIPYVPMPPPSSAETTTVVEQAPSSTLPATGSEQTIAVSAGGFVLAGIGALVIAKFARRPNPGGQ